MAEKQRQEQHHQRRFILHISRPTTTTVWTYFEAHDFSNLPPDLREIMQDELDFQQEIGSGDGGGGGRRGGGGQPTGIWYKAVRNHHSTSASVSTTVVNSSIEGRVSGSNTTTSSRSSSLIFGPAAAAAAAAEGCQLTQNGTIQCNTRMMFRTDK